MQPTLLFRTSSRSAMQQHQESQTNSVDVIAIGDNSGDSPAPYDDASTMQDFVAIGDNTVDGAEGHGCDPSW